MDLLQRKKLKVEKRIFSKCCICGSQFEGEGNNAEPFMNGGKCCDECYDLYVIPQKNKVAKLEHKIQ